MATTVVRGALFIRPAKLVKLGRGEQRDEFLGSPPTIQLISYRYGDGAAQGDSVASGDFTALGDFAGAASGDAVASGTFTALGDFAGAASGDAVTAATGDSTVFDFSSWTELLLRRGPSRAVKLGRGAQYEFQSPTPLRAVVAVTIDAVGAATGDSVAAAGFDAFGDFAGSALGDSVAAAAGDSTFDGVSISGPPFEQGSRTWLGRGGQLDIHQAFPLTVPVAVSSDGAGAATGDAAAAGTLDAFGDFAGAATGDAIASATFTALGDFAGAASGDAIAAATFTALGDFAGAAQGDSIASATATATGDFAGAATGDAIASGALDALGDFAGAATGDAVADAAGATDNVQDCAGTAVGDANCDGFIEDATPAVVTPSPVVTAGGVGRLAWRDHYRKKLPKKKRKLVDELDEMIAALQERVIIPEVAGFDEAAYERTLRVSQALAQRSDLDKVAEATIRDKIGLLKRAVEEIDDEEAILLALS